ECGWPGSNPTADAFFGSPPALKHARLAAFGMTPPTGRSAAPAPGRASTCGSGANVASLVGTTWGCPVTAAPRPAPRAHAELGAVRAGARQVQRTLNGLGERCGNANLVSLIPSLMLKMGYITSLGDAGLKRLTHVSRLLDERLNRSPDRHAAYVGEAAFAHKG